MLCECSAGDSVNSEGEVRAIFEISGGGGRNFQDPGGMAYDKTPGHYVFNFGLHNNPIFNFTK